MDIKKFILANRVYTILFVSLLIIQIFSRFYNFESLNPFGWDQTDTAWAAKNILVEHKYPLVGMAARQNSGFYIGPLYYYLVAGVYSLTNLDPVASGIIAVITSLVSFLVIYIVTFKIFNKEVALLTAVINTFSVHILTLDRVQWPVTLIPAVSILIFYTLYMVLKGNERYLVWLGVFLGLSFNIHFTSIFFPLIILCCMPFFPRTRKTLIYGLLGFLCFLALFSPVLISELTKKGVSSNNLSSYLNIYYHGVHLTRIMQVMKDAFIEMESLLFFRTIGLWKYILLPVFVFLLYVSKNKDKNILAYLIALWVLIPWIVFSTYSGEITNYYFTLTRPLGLMALGFIFYYFLKSQVVVYKIISIVLLVVYITTGIYYQSQMKGENTLTEHRKLVDTAIGQGVHLPFQEGVPKAFIYYIYTREK